MASTTHPDAPHFTIRRLDVTGRAGERWGAFTEKWFSGECDDLAQAKAAADAHFNRLLRMPRANAS